MDSIKKHPPKTDEFVSPTKNWSDFEKGRQACLPSIILWKGDMLSFRGSKDIEGMFQNQLQNHEPDMLLSASSNPIREVTLPKFNMESKNGTLE